MEKRVWDRVSKRWAYIEFINENTNRAHLVDQWGNEWTRHITCINF